MWFYFDMKHVQGKCQIEPLRSEPKHEEGLRIQQRYEKLGEGAPL